MAQHQRQATSQLVLFDLDGTLMPGTSTTLYLAEQLGHIDQVAQLEQEYRAGRIDNTTVAIESGALLKDVPLRDVETLFQKAPKIRNISETVTHLHRNGFTVVLGSITWSFFVRLFAQEFDFDGYCGTDMEISKGTLTGRVTNVCTEQGKLSFFVEWRDKLGIAHEQTVAVGDSRSDHLVFEQAGVSIALNADHATREIATFSLETNDLMEVVRLIA